MNFIDKLSQAYVKIVFTVGPWLYTDKQWDGVESHIQRKMLKSMIEVQKIGAPILDAEGSTLSSADRRTLECNLKILQEPSRQDAESALDYICRYFQAYKESVDLIVALASESKNQYVINKVMDSVEDNQLSGWMGPEKAKWSFIQELADYYNVSDTELDQVKKLYQEESCAFVVWYMLGVALENSEGATAAQVDLYYKAMLLHLYRQMRNQ